MREFIGNTFKAHDNLAATLLKYARILQEHFYANENIPETL